MRILEIATLRKKANRAHKGQAAVEMVMSVLMFVIMLAMVMSISLYLYVQHTLLTAAREGARIAAVDPNFGSAGTTSVGTANVQAWVRNFVSSGTGIALANNNITVAGPTGAAGSRNITVTLNYTFQNPVQVLTLLNRLGGGAATGLDTITMSSNATMRYEE